LDGFQGQVWFFGKVFGLGLFEIGVKGKSAQSIIGHLLIGHSPFVIKVLGVMPQDVTMQGWLLRSQRFPIFANLQPPPLRPVPIWFDRFAL
jgi:hypothetical protein